MKSLIIVSILVAGAMAQALPNQQFQCVNNMFREARYDVLNDQILIQDTFLEGTQELEAALEESLNLKDKLSIQQVAIQVAKDESVCATEFAPLVNCSIENKKAVLLIEGHITGNAGLSGGINLRLYVKLNKLDVNSHLASEGPIDLGSSPVTIPMNRVVLEANAQVDVGGKNVDLKFTPFFFNGQSSGNAYCKVL